MRQITELKEKAAKATSRFETVRALQLTKENESPSPIDEFGQANAALKKRVEQLENEIDARKRLQEQLEVTRKKLEALEKHEPDSKLQQDLDQLRVGHPFCANCGIFHMRLM